MSRSWLLLQLADSAFPTGGFVHSFGLEAAWQQGEVRNEVELDQFVKAWCWQAGFGALPLVSAAHESPGQLAIFDARMECFLVSHVARRASRTQGRAFLDTCTRIFPEVRAVQEQARAERLAQHYAPLFGAVLAALGLSLNETQRLFLSLGSRGVLSAAVRLGAVGTHAAQRLMGELGSELTRVLERCSDLREDELAQTAPLLDLFGATHDRLYSRLFQS